MEPREDEEMKPRCGHGAMSETHWVNKHPFQPGKHFSNFCICGAHIAHPKHKRAERLGLERSTASELAGLLKAERVEDSTMKRNEYKRIEPTKDLANAVESIARLCRANTPHVFSQPVNWIECSEPLTEEVKALADAIASFDNWDILCAAKVERKAALERLNAMEMRG